jgi:hypothetical protein
MRPGSGRSPPRGSLIQWTIRPRGLDSTVAGLRCPIVASPTPGAMPDGGLPLRSRFAVRAALSEALRETTASDEHQSYQRTRLRLLLSPWRSGRLARPSQDECVSSAAAARTRPPTLLQCPVKQQRDSSVAGPILLIEADGKVGNFRGKQLGAILDRSDWFFEYSLVMTSSAPWMPVAANQARQVARRLALTFVVAVLFVGALGSPTRALAAANADEMLTYIPTGLVHNKRTAAEVNGYLADLTSYDIGQPLLQMPRFKKTGAVTLPRSEKKTLSIWVSQAATYNAEHGTDMTVTAVFNGDLKKKGLDLENPATRANMISAIESVVGMGVSGVHLDLEPYPVTSGFLSLLEELDATFARLGFHGRFSVVAPANTSRWTPSYLQQVSQLVTQIDPLYYDSELATIPAYEAWVEKSLAYYTANASSSVRIVPVIPSYSADPWHIPSVENIESATVAVSDALTAGSRINGVGIWWWWGFFYDEEGGYNASADRAAWQSTTVNLPLSP